MPDPTTSSPNQPATAESIRSTTPSPNLNIGLPEPKGGGMFDDGPGSMGDFLKSITETAKKSGDESFDPRTPFAPPTDPTQKVDIEAKPQPQAKPDAPTDDSKPPTGPGSHKRWDELKAKEKRLADLEKAHEQAEKERAELKKWREEKEKEAAVSREEYEKLKKEREELANEIKVVDITRDPEFRSQISEPLMNTLREALEHIPAEFQQEARAALTADTRPAMAKALHALSEKLEPWQIEALKGYAGDVYPLLQKYKYVIANAGSLAQKREMERAEALKQQQQNRLSIFEKSLSEAASEDSLKPFFTGETEQDKKVAADRIREIREFADAMDEPENIARAAIWSRIGPELRKQNAELRKQLDEFKKSKEKVAQLADTTPNPTTTAGATSSDDDDSDISAAGFLKRFNRG